MLLNRLGDGTEELNHNKITQLKIQALPNQRPYSGRYLWVPNNQRVIFFAFSETMLPSDDCLKKQ
jgi:hypothetical protein